MPVSYRIDVERKLVIATCDNAVTDGEVLAHIKGVFGDPNFNPGFAQLIDCSGSTDFKVSVELIHHLANGRPLVPCGRWAIAAPQLHVFGMARMFQIESGHSALEVFRDLTAALEWLENKRESSARAAAV